MSKIPAHWEIAPEIVALRNQLAPETLIVGNGDIRDKQHGLRLISETGMDGMMIGRGIFTNVFGFEDAPCTHGKIELLQLLLMHFDLFEDSKTRKPYQTLKRFFKIYVRDFDGAHELRNKLMESESIDEARAILDAYLK